MSKTYHGGLKDLKKTSKVVNHICHDPIENGSHYRCLVDYYRMYFELIGCLSKISSTFYFRPNRSKFVFDDVAVGIHKLNNIVPELMQTAGLPGHKTAHSLRVTCASSLFNSGVDQKLVRDRTGHTSDAVFAYEKTSTEVMAKVSSILNPPIFSGEKRSFHSEENVVNESIVENKKVKGEKRGFDSEEKVKENIVDVKKAKPVNDQPNSGGFWFQDCNITLNVNSK